MLSLSKQSRQALQLREERGCGSDGELQEGLSPQDVIPGLTGNLPLKKASVMNRGSSLFMGVPPTGSGYTRFAHRACSLGPKGSLSLTRKLLTTQARID